MTVEDWHREHSAYVLAFCTKRLGAEDGADAAGEVWHKAHRSFARFDEGMSVRAWLTGIAHNECTDQLRRRRRASPHTSFDPRALVHLDNMPEEKDSITAAEDALVAARIVMDALAQMNDEQARAVYAYVVGGMPYEEIARLEKVPIGTIRSRMAKARAILRRLAAGTHILDPLRNEDLMTRFKDAVLARRVERMRGAIDDPGRYLLGQGGMDPQSPTPYSDAGFCDCTGAVAWALEISRKPKSSRHWWIESTACVRDITGPQTVFHRVYSPVAGCVGFYPDQYTMRGGHRTKLHEGHGFVVSAVRSASDFDIIDCSPRNDDDDGKAINERNGNWTIPRGAVFAVLKQDLEEAA